MDLRRNWKKGASLTVYSESKICIRVKGVSFWLSLSYPFSFAYATFRAMGMRIVTNLFKKKCIVVELNLSCLLNFNVFLDIVEVIKKKR